MANKYSYIKIVTLSLNTQFHSSSHINSILIFYFTKKKKKWRSILIFSLKGITRDLHVPPRPVPYKTRKIQNQHTMIDCFIGNFISAQDFWKATVIISTFGNQLKWISCIICQLEASNTFLPSYFISFFFNKIFTETSFWFKIENWQSLA